MANEKRKRKRKLSTSKKPSKPKSKKPLPKKTRVRVTRKNAKRIARKVRKVKRTRVVARKVARRKSNRVVTRKTRKVRRITKRKPTRRARKRVTKFKGPPVVVTHDMVQRTTEIALPNGDFWTKLKAVENLDLNELEKQFRYLLPNGTFLFADAVFLVMVGLHSSGQEYYLNHVTPNDKQPNPEYLKPWLINEVKRWLENYNRRKEANQLTEKSYDLASSPDALDRLILKWIFATLPKTENI